MKKLLIAIQIVLFSAPLIAQEPADALRLSHSINSGTARFVSMGGAFGALGADFTALSYNPAGLGVYRSSQFMATASLKNKVDNTLYQDQKLSDSRSSLLFDNFGIVSTRKIVKELEDEEAKEKGLQFVNIGIGYNRIADFYSETSAFGANRQNSIMNHFANQANGINWADLATDDGYDPYRAGIPWDIVMAWNSYLIDTIAGSNNQYTRMLNQNDEVLQDQNLSSIGGIGEFVFSVAANYSNKLYFGATIGAQNIYFKQTQYFWEKGSDQNAPLPNDHLFESLDYQQNLTIEGRGYNLKIGAIYIPIPNLRAGFAFHTPTYYNLSESYRASIKSEFNNFDLSSSTPQNNYDYKIQSPYKFIGSLAYLFGSKGLLSIDYEHVDYAVMKFGRGGDGYRFLDENKEINNLYTNTFNLKAGGEVWLNHLALRAGYAYYGSPYVDGIPLASSATQVLSAGFGLRIDNVFIDWAYQRYNFSDKYTLYYISPVVDRDVVQNKFFFTVGFKF